MPQHTLKVGTGGYLARLDETGTFRDALLLYANRFWLREARVKFR